MYMTYSSLYVYWTLQLDKVVVFKYRFYKFWPLSRCFRSYSFVSEIIRLSTPYSFLTISYRFHYQEKKYESESGEAPSDRFHPACLLPSLSPFPGLPSLFTVFYMGSFILAHVKLSLWRPSVTCANHCKAHGLQLPLFVLFSAIYVQLCLLQRSIMLIISVFF